MDKWTKSDKKIAKELFELARKRDYQKLMNEIQLKAKNLEESQSIWDLRDFLNAKAKEFDQRYDYRYSVLNDVFVNFIYEDLLSFHELQAFSKEKQERIESILNLLGKLS